jgi:hypothetical protein
MNVERCLRMIAGAFVMASVALGYWVHPAWFLFTVFVGLNLFQSAFTDWCPMMTFLKKRACHRPALGEPVPVGVMTQMRTKQALPGIVPHAVLAGVRLAPAF